MTPSSLSASGFGKRRLLLLLSAAGMSRARICSFQKVNHGLRSVLIIRDDILDTAAKSSLHCSFIFLIGLDQISHNSPDSRVFLLFVPSPAGYCCRSRHTARLDFSGIPAVKLPCGTLSTDLHLPVLFRQQLLD